MNIELITKAERCAELALGYKAFSGINLLHIKRQLADIFSLIGRGDIFEEYTKHDISHVDEMLKILEWLIPEGTKNNMSPADWLMTVLAIYFHDLGMLVTKKEFELREKSGFNKFREEVLYSGSQGKDYKTAISKLKGDQIDKFLYQEFVRDTHAERVCLWIQGKENSILGITPELNKEVERLLNPLDHQFRKDLGMICASHHLSDINDTKKYKVKQPYGNSDFETVNLQYSAILLRSADLLHITSDRTPSTIFRTISPSNPLSQQEWAKQMSVKRVMSKTGIDKDGLPSPDAPKDTIEIYAFFKEPEAFFGLISYVNYLQQQIKECYNWAQQSNKYEATNHNFPWKYIDTSNIQTEGFEQKLFEFTIDQPKILDLLTGHTLYNNTSVVLREIIQNSIDAIKVQNIHDRMSDITSNLGKIYISWDSKNGMLSVEDQGTGMTQTIIENNLLRVGSSRYQDADFKKSYPNFSPISRFGIGILSAFMIADEVEIFTCSEDDEKARHISLRTVQGKYLMRLLDKNDEDIKNIYPHGTRVTLKVRPSTEMSDVEANVEHWVAIPGCEVFISVDNGQPKIVGFRSVKEALSKYLENMGILCSDDLSTSTIRVIEKKLDGLDLAFAVEWIELFKEWLFLDITELKIEESEKIMLGTCVEGIRVTNETPGYINFGLVAMANCYGQNSPKTNVARTDFEETKEKEEMIRKVYSLYAEHIKEEIIELNKKRSFSLTWAVEESFWILNPLITMGMRYYGNNKTGAIREQILLKEISKIPLLLVEKNGTRFSISPESLDKEDRFWMVDSELFRAIEWSIKEIPGNISLSTLGKAFNIPNYVSLNESVLCWYPQNVIDSILSTREVDKIVVRIDQRRIDLSWAKIKGQPKWNQFNGNEYITFHGMRTFTDGKLVVACKPIELEGLQDEIAVHTMGLYFLVFGSHLAIYLNNWIESHHNKLTSDNIIEYKAIEKLIIKAMNNEVSKIKDEEDIKNELNAIIDNMSNDFAITIGSKLRIIKGIDMEYLVDVILKTKFKMFDPSKWQRRAKKDGVVYNE